jgi:hypothetical protein
MDHGGSFRIRVALAALAAAALTMAVGACGTEQSISDAKIVDALDLEQAGGAYRVDGDPFCTVDELLRDADEVESANDTEGASFLIASPDGDVGVLARQPFPSDCTRQVKDGLKRLDQQAD